MLQSLGAQPLLDLDLRLGEGTGAVLALPILKAAAAMVREVASLAEVLGQA
jgi:nicotinate-nucleotide--dimethylbenzimidazole phosphoribosyltransferase